MHPRHSRRTLRFAIGALLLAAPVLTSCGFDYATDRVNDHTAGSTDHGAAVDVLNALVVAAEPNSGTLLGLLSNNDDQEHALTSLTGPEDAPVDFDEVEIPADGSAQLADAGVRIDGAFEAGDFIDLTLTFDNGDEVAIAVPVVTACGQYEGLDDAPATSGAEDDEATSHAEAYSCEAEEAPEAGH